MKKFLLIALFFQAISIFADDITIESFKIKKGETKTVEVIVENAADMLGDNPTSCAIELPAGLNWEGKNASAAHTERLVEFGTTNYTVSKKTNKLALSILSAEIEAGKGALWTFKVTATDAFEGGDILITAKFVNGVQSANSSTKVELDEDAPTPRTEAMYISDFAIEKGKTMTVEVILNNAEAYPGDNPTSCAIELPTGLNWEGKNASAAHTERLVDFGTTNYTVSKKTNKLALSILSAEIEAGTGALWTFQIKADDDFDGGVIKMTSIFANGVQQPDVEVIVTAAPALGIDNAIVNVENNAVVYDLVGRQVNANAKGILIKNGKKFIVK